MGKCLLIVGKYELNDKHWKILSDVFGSYTPYYIRYVKTIDDIFMKIAEIEADTSHKCRDVVVVSLPMHMLVELVSRAVRLGVNVYKFRMQSLGLFKQYQEAVQTGADIVAKDHTEDKWRATSIIGLIRIARLELEEEEVWKEAGE